MRTIFYVLTRPFVWLWKLLSSGLTVLSNLLFLALFLFILTVLFIHPKSLFRKTVLCCWRRKEESSSNAHPWTQWGEFSTIWLGIPLHEETFLQDVLDARIRRRR
jgi:protease IV